MYLSVNNTHAREPFKRQAGMGFFPQTIFVCAAKYVHYEDVYVETIVWPVEHVGVMVGIGNYLPMIFHAHPGFDDNALPDPGSKRVQQPAPDR